MAFAWRSVPLNEWKVSEEVGRERILRLVDPIGVEILISTVKDESLRAAQAGRVEVVEQESHDWPGYTRIEAKIPLSENTFDQFFNGRSGYRAQYYLSPEEGIYFNRRSIEALGSSIQIANRLGAKPLEDEFIDLSLSAPHSKIWIHEETAAFDNSAETSLLASRWVGNGAVRGLRLPLHTCTLHVKGSFIRQDGNFVVDDLKLERPCDLHRRGYT